MQLDTAAQKTQNVDLWLGNDEPNYRAAVKYMATYKGSDPYKDYVKSQGLTSTPDGVSYSDSGLNIDSLNEAMAEFATHNQHWFYRKH